MVALAPMDTDEVAVNADVGPALTTAITLMVEGQPLDGVTVHV